MCVFFSLFFFFHFRLDFSQGWKLTAENILEQDGPHVPSIDWTKLVVRNKCTWIHWCRDMMRLSKYNYVCESIKRCYPDSSSFTRQIFSSYFLKQCMLLSKCAGFPTMTWGWRNNLPATLFESFCHCFFSCMRTAAMITYWLCIGTTAVSDLMLWAAQQVLSGLIYRGNAMRTAFSCGIPTGRNASLLNTQ